jgi:hypothetical protein
MMTAINKNYTAFLLLLLLTCQAGVVARLEAQDGSPTATGEMMPLFQPDDPLHLTLSMDIRTVIRDIEEEDSHPAELSYTDQNGNIIKLPIKVKVRGNFRKDPVNCDFPPLRINFSSATVKNTIFEGQDKIKLVTHCRSGRDLYEQNVLKEYLAYKLYNLFTPESFGVRLVHLTYADTGGKQDTLKKMAFLLEPEEQLARRNGCEILEVKGVRQDRTERNKTTMMAIFQYMIGNTDWSVWALHNVLLLKKSPTALPIVVPYDFDWCGLVQAPYAFPPKQLPIESVRERLFRGFCRPDSVLQPLLEEFRQRKEVVYQTCRAIPNLTDKELRQIIKYMDQFYKTLDNPRAVEVEFHRNCRNK